MANNTLLTDDYVAELLAKEAKESSLKYSVMGMEAYRSKPAHKLKPNTRFLRHIIKETTNHNEALLAKEAAESQTRLQGLADAEADKRRKFRPEAKEVRRRQLGNIESILGDAKRKRVKNDERGGEIVRLSDADRRQERDERRRGHTREESQGKVSSRHSRTRSTERRRDASGDSEREHSRSHKRRRRESDIGERSHRTERKRRDRSRSPHRSKESHRQRSLASEKKKDMMFSIDKEEPGRLKRRARSLDEDRHVPSKTTHMDADDRDDDSDPLEDLIGPRTLSSTTRPRGRGAAAALSGINSRFSASYDPTVDVEPDPGNDDWEDAMEAFRDRQKWKQQGATRLRAAGFSDDQVKKWEKGGEKDSDDVRWSKKGEKREWDRGKKVGTDGAVTSQPDWA